MSGSAFEVAVEMGVERVFLVRGMRVGVVDAAERAGSLPDRMLFGFLGRGVEPPCAGGLILSRAFTGDLKGVLKGERKGFERAWEASMRRRLAAGVDILIFVVG